MQREFVELQSRTAFAFANSSQRLRRCAPTAARNETARNQIRPTWPRASAQSGQLNFVATQRTLRAALASVLPIYH